MSAVQEVTVTADLFIYIVLIYIANYLGHIASALRGIEWTLRGIERNDAALIDAEETETKEKG